MEKLKDCKVYKVEIEGYGYHNRYVIATSFDDAERKVIEEIIMENSEKTPSVIDSDGSLIQIAEEKEIVVKAIECIANKIII